MTLISYDEEGRNYSLNKNVRSIEFRLVWWPVDQNGDLTFEDEKPQCREVGFDALAVRRQGGWDIHNVTPQERIPAMEAINVKPFMEALHKALSEALDGPIVRFPTGVVDWDMMVDDPSVIKYQPLMERCDPHGPPYRI